MSRTYFTGSDARIEFMNHPDPRWNGQPLDVAHFSFTAGSTPIPIYNYADRSDSESRPYLKANRPNEDLKPSDDDVIGGAPFDDVAIGNHITELRLAMNQKRFTQVKSKFQAMTDIGDMLIRYKNSTSWRAQGDQQSAGYELIDGSVNQVGEEIAIGSATFPSITITFSYSEPISATPGSSGGSSALFSGEGSRGDQRQVRFVPVEASYYTNDVLRSFDPSQVDKVFGTGNPLADMDPLDTDYFWEFSRASVERATIEKSTGDWFREQPYIIAPFLEEIRQNGRRLWAWSTRQEQYVLTSQRSARPNRPILGESPSEELTGGQVSTAGIDAIKTFEGFSATWYDVSDNPTIGHGLRSQTLDDDLGVTRDGMPFNYNNFPDVEIDEEESTPWVRMDVRSRTSDVEGELTRDPTQHEFDAMVSLAYNIGVNAFADSDLVTYFNNGDLQGAADEFLKWNKDDGTVVEGLTNRRKDERRIFLYKDYSLTNSH